MRFERIAIATGFAAMTACTAIVSLCGVLGRAFGGGPWAPELAAVLSVCAALLLGALARSGRGPVAWLAARLPEVLDGSFARRRGRSILVGLLMVVAVGQTARLSCFMSDDTLRWGSAFPPLAEGVEHMCLASYVQAGELARRPVPNVYEESHYPAFSDAAFGQAAVADSPVDHIEPYIEDAYEYPPPFLLLPRLALALSNDYMVHRTAWFALQALAFLAFALLLLRRLSEEARVVALLLLPAYVATLPGMFTLQFGQWHLPAVLLSMGAMLAISSERAPLGGALLAAAVVTKVFPGLLLVYLLARKRWRAVIWTGGWCVVYTAIAYAVLGSQPFVAFVEYQLPRMASGEAFSFFLKSDLVIASNYGVYGIPVKLGKLGVPGMGLGLASGLTWIYGIALLGVAAFTARRGWRSVDEPAVWLALLVLASLRSPLAPSVYTAAPALWLLTFEARRIGRTTRGVVVVVLGFFAMGGLPPMPTPKATIAVWMTGQVAVLVLGFWTVLRRPAQVA